MHAGGDRRGGPRLRPARPRRRRLPDGHQVGVRAAVARRRQVHHLQRRRGRPRRVHGRLHHGRRSARRARGHADRRATRSARTRATSTCAPSTRWPCKRLRHGHRRRRGARLPRRRRRSAAAGTSTSRSRRAPAPSSAARRRRSSPPSRASAACRARGRRSRPSPASGASRPTSTTSRPSPTCPGSSRTAPAAYAASAARRARAPRPSRWPARSSTAASSRCRWARTLRHVIFDVGGGIKDGRDVQGRAARRPVGRLRAGEPAGHAGRLREPRRDRRHHGLRRHGRRRRHHLHGRPRQVLPAVHPERELRQVRALPHRHQAHARDPRAHHRAARARTGDIEQPRDAGAQRSRRRASAVSARRRPTRCSPRSSYFRDEYEAHIAEQRCPALACKALIAYAHRPGGLHRLHAVRQEVPGRRASRGEQEAAARDRPGAVHQVRRLPRACKFDAVKIVSGPRRDRRRRGRAGGG